MNLARIAHRLALVLSFSCTGVAAAAEPAPEPVRWTVAVLGEHAFAVDLEHGGQASATRGGVSLSVSRRFVPAFSGSVNVGYERTEWTFDAPIAFGSAAPWTTLQRPSVGLGLQLALSPRFVVNVGPGAEWSFAEDAEARDGVVYGASVGAAGIFTPQFTLGGGAKIQRQYFSTKVTAFVIVNAKLSPTVRIANASGTGPLGSGGVELRFAPDETKEFAIGGVYRSTRFRLAPTGPGKGDVGETGGIPLLARASYGKASGVRADLSAGVVVSGRVERRDPDGRTLVKEDLATVPVVALTFATRW